MIETRRLRVDTTPRPEFARELLARLELGSEPRATEKVAGKVVAGALGGATVSATIALLVARRRQGR